MRTPRRLKGRRGATLILVALLMVPLVCLAAFSIDVGWWQVGANQLQTTADASALAGARALMLYRGQVNVQATAEAYAVQTGTANTAFSQTVSLTGADIAPMFYNPATRDTTPSTWENANAVRVTARATPGLVLAGVSRAVAPTIARNGVAWIANINNGTCVKPWGLPYQVLYDRLQSITQLPTTASTASPRPDLDPGAFAKLGQMIEANNSAASEAARAIIFRPPTYDGVGMNPDSSAAGYNHGMYAGYNFTNPTGHGANASGELLQANTWGCSNQTVSVTAGTGVTLPGNNDIPCRIVNALMGSDDNTCEQSSNGNPWEPTGNAWPVGNNNPRIAYPPSCHWKAPVGTVWDAGCYPPSSPSGPAGVMQIVAWGDNIYNGSNAVDFRELGKIKVLCVFRGISLAAGYTERCSPAGGVPLQNYPKGTIVGVIIGITSPVIGPNTELGNVVSDQQRLILVR